MPITITPQNPAGLVGPGLSVKLQSDFIGPFPTSTVWTISFQKPGGTEAPVEMQWQQGANPVTVTPYISDSRTTVSARADEVFLENSTVNVNATVQSQGGGAADDSGQVTGTWSNTAGMTNVIDHGASSSGGFTADDRAQLEQVGANTVVTGFLDKLTLAEITNGIQGGFASIHVAAAGYGVIVRIAHVPDDLVPNTPDGDYWVPSLAIVRVFRNADLWLRIPVHTSNKMCMFFGDRIILGIPDALVAEWFLNLTVQVTFRDGVEGQAFVMTLP